MNDSWSNSSNLIRKPVHFVRQTTDTALVRHTLLEYTSELLHRHWLLLAETDTGSRHMSSRNTFTLRVKQFDAALTNLVAMLHVRTVTQIMTNCACPFIKATFGILEGDLNLYLTNCFLKYSKQHQLHCSSVLWRQPTQAGLLQLPHWTKNPMLLQIWQSVRAPASCTTQRVLGRNSSDLL